MSKELIHPERQFQVINYALQNLDNLSPRKMAELAEQLKKEGWTLSKHHHSGEITLDSINGNYEIGLYSHNDYTALNIIEKSVQWSPNPSEKNMHYIHARSPHQRAYYIENYRPLPIGNVLKTPDKTQKLIHDSLNFLELTLANSLLIPEAA